MMMNGRLSVLFTSSPYCPLHRSDSRYLALVCDAGILLLLPCFFCLFACDGGDDPPGI